MRYSTELRKHLTETPQTKPIPGAEQRMVKNDAGGYAFDAGPWVMLDRFLLIGTEGGTYYIGQRDLTVRNAENVIECLKLDGQKVVSRVVEISEAGRAPSNDPALFVLALAMSPQYADTETRRAAAVALPRVARTASHLFTFVAEVDQLRGWGSFLSRSVGAWYEDKPVDRLGYQVIKYQQRQGWSHRDLLRKVRPRNSDVEHDALYRYITHGPDGLDSAQWEVGLPRIVQGVEAVKSAKTEADVIGIVREFRLTHEMVPTQWKKSPAVWEALLYGMPIFAMVRNLGAMTANGLLTPNSDAVVHVVRKLTNAEAVTKSRIHPISVLKALRTYDNGQGFRGRLSWRPVQAVSGALEDTFYMAFDNIEPTGKRYVLGLDVSSSMSSSWGMGSAVKGMAGMHAAELAAAMMMVTVRSERLVEPVAFAHDLRPFPITRHDSLTKVQETADRMNFGGTDCAQPMLYALRNGISADAFVIYTDNETWYGNIHPMQALTMYRDQTGIPAKLVVVGMTGQRYSIADPKDPGTLDVVGFDTSFPAFLSKFVASE
jgi:60 kDa SS-A/Ro ribonucleoprotein